MKIHVTYIIAIDSGGENSSSDTVNSYDHNCIGRYMRFHFFKSLHLIVYLLLKTISFCCLSLLCAVTDHTLILRRNLRARQKRIALITAYTRKNAQVVTSLQTSCNKSVHKLCSHCLFLVCCDKFGTSC